MNFGFDTTWLFLQKWIGRCIIRIHFPSLKFGIFTNKFENEKFVGLKLLLNNELYYEKYDYGFVFNIIIFGFGFSINRVNV